MYGWGMKQTESRENEMIEPEECEPEPTGAQYMIKYAAAFMSDTTAKGGD